MEADTRKSTSLLKRHLKDTFGIDVKIKSEKYSMGCSLNISYALGPDSKEVENICKALQYGHFNSMEDIYEYDNDKAGLVVDGYKLEEFKHVFVRQEISTELYYKLAKMMSDNMKFQGVPALENIEQMNTSFQERSFNAWTWKDMIYQSLRVHNFATQDESKIILRSVHNSEKDTFGIYFIYEVDGVEYNTEFLPVKEAKAAIKPNFEPLEVKAGEVNIIEYSEKAIAVIGDTKSIKDQLKALGGRFNFRLTCGPGWIFPKTKLAEIQTALC